MQIIDLTIPIHDSMPVFPGDMDVSIKPYHTLEMGYSNVKSLFLGTHTGTHIDAPYHFFADGKTLDEIPLNRFVGEAILVDCVGRRDAIHIADLEPFSQDISPCSRVIIRTGWDKWFGEEKYFRDYPVISAGVAKWLAERQIWLLGVDIPSVDGWKNEDAHVALLKAEVVIVESLVNLDKITKTPFYFAALPLPIKGADGSPVRAIALQDENL